MVFALNCVHFQSMGGGWPLQRPPAADEDAADEGPAAAELAEDSPLPPEDDDAAAAAEWPAAAAEAARDKWTKLDTWSQTCCLCISGRHQMRVSSLE